MQPPEVPDRRLQLAIQGETGVSILINGNPVNDPRGPGEYWVRITGTVPKGEGMIAAFPFLHLQPEKETAEPGSFVFYELSF